MGGGSFVANESATMHEISDECSNDNLFHDVDTDEGGSIVDPSSSFPSSSSLYFFHHMGRFTKKKGLHYVGGGKHAVRELILIYGQI